jgi:hypothetical protein
MTNKTYQGWSEWENNFNPIKNHFSKDPHEQMFADEYLFATNFGTQISI